MPTDHQHVIEAFRAARLGLPRFTFQARAPQAKKKDTEAAATVGELYLYDSIGNDFWGGGIGAKDVVKALDELKAKGAKELCLYINSPGGDVFEAVAMYNVIKRFDGKKSVCVDALCASAATIVAMVADEGELVTAHNGMWMIHQPWGFAMGNADDMRKTAETLDQVSSTMLETYAKRTGQDLTKLKELCDAETWLTAQQAKDLGFTDKVLDEDDDEQDGKEDGGEADPAAKAAAAAELVAFPLLNKFQKTPDALRAAASSSRTLVASLEKRLNHRRASPVVTPAGPPAK